MILTLLITCLVDFTVSITLTDSSGHKVPGLEEEDFVMIVDLAPIPVLLLVWLLKGWEPIISFRLAFACHTERCCAVGGTNCICAVGYDDTPSSSGLDC